MNDGTGLAEALLGLGGFGVLAVGEMPAEVVIEIETTVEVVGCGECGTRAEAHERMPVEIRDLACYFNAATRAPTLLSRTLDGQASASSITIGSDFLPRCRRAMAKSSRPIDTTPQTIRKCG